MRSFDPDHRASEFCRPTVAQSQTEAAQLEPEWAVRPDFL